VGRPVLDSFLTSLDDHIIVRYACSTPITGLITRINVHQLLFPSREPRLAAPRRLRRPLDVRSLRTLGDKRVAPYTTVELVVLCHPLWLDFPTTSGPRALVDAGLEARPPSAGLRPCCHKNTLLNSEQILLRNKFSNLLPIRDISSILTS